MTKEKDKKIISLPTIKTYLIYDFIKENHLTKIEFCKLANISTSTLYKILNNKNFFLISLVKIIRVLNIELYEIFY